MVEEGAELLGDGVAVRSRRRGCLTQCARGVPSRQRGLDAREVGRVVGRVELVAQRKEPGGKDRVADMEFGEVAARFECPPLEDGPAKLEQPKRLRRRVGLAGCKCQRGRVAGQERELAERMLLISPGELP